MDKKFITMLRREIWEHKRSLQGFVGLIALFVLANLFFVVAEKTGYGHISGSLKYRDGLEILLVGTFWLIDMTLLLLMVFLSLDGLYGERRQNTMLFWKSLPVEDELVVASKMFFYVLVVPIVAISTIMFSQVLTLSIQSLIFSASLDIFSEWWRQMNMLSLWKEMLSVLAGQSLWYFPVIAWLLLCSAWAPRSTPYVPAILPPVLLVVVDDIFNLQSGIPQLLAARTPFASPVGMNAEKLGAIKNDASVPFSSLVEFDLWPFLTDVQMWLGLVVGVIFLLLAARIRRWQGDIG